MAQRTPEMLQFLAKQRPQKLFHIVNKLQRFGEGRKVTRVIWKQEDTSINILPSYWTITRVRPDQVEKREGGGDGRGREGFGNLSLHVLLAAGVISLQSLMKGKIWGVFSWRGM